MGLLNGHNVLKTHLEEEKAKLKARQEKQLQEVELKKQNECKIEPVKLTDNILRDVNDTLLTGTMLKPNKLNVVSDVIVSTLNTTIGNLVNGVNKQDKCLKGLDKEKEITKVEDCNIDKKSLALKTLNNLNSGMLTATIVNVTTGGAITPIIVGSVALGGAHDLKDALDKKQECKINNGFIDEPEKKNQIFKEEVIKKVEVKVEAPKIIPKVVVPKINIPKPTITNQFNMMKHNPINVPKIEMHNKIGTPYKPSIIKQNRSNFSLGGFRF